MAYTVPTFNLSVNVFTGPTIGGIPRITVNGNLAWGRRVNAPNGGGGTPDVTSVLMSLLLPIGTDIRDQVNASGSDNVEVPAGSGRYYTVCYVDDIGKGFENEHRCAILQKSIGPSDAPWPTPIP